MGCGGTLGGVGTRSFSGGGDGGFSAAGTELVASVAAFLVLFFVGFSRGLCAPMDFHASLFTVVVYGGVFVAVVVHGGGIDGSRICRERKKSLGIRSYEKIILGEGSYFRKNKIKGK